MSTSSGNVNKGEKGKKFQQLKINLCSANKPSEPEQQQSKSSIQRKQHGMTSLGKVPTARRPTNLPSEKSEHSGNDPSVNLVPSGGAGWGNKTDTGPTTPSLGKNTTPPTNVPMNNGTLTGTSQQAPPVQHYPATSRMPPAAMGGHVPVHHGHPDSKTWAVMAHGGDSSAPNFLAPQSPLFQHEFPSLSANSETSSAAVPATATATQKPSVNTSVDSQYGPGPSLRPQTEGSWIHGGSRPQGAGGSANGSQSTNAPAQAHPLGPYPQHLGPDGARNNLAHSGAVAGPAGHFPPVMPQQHMMPPQFNGMMPHFMMRNFSSGNYPQNFQGSVKSLGPRPPYGSYPPNSASDSNSKRSYDEEDMKIRPIIKDEDLSHMASIGKDIGWAGNEDIDYNQKLKFSDDEDDDKGKENYSTMRPKSQLAKNSDKTAEMKDAIEKDNDLRSSKESLKEREKLHNSDMRPPEIRNAWQMPRTILNAAAPPTARYQIPAIGRFEEDEETYEEQIRRRKEEMDKFVQRAMERKEEEEKRFNEQQLAATVKLRKLEAEMLPNQSGKENKVPSGNDSGELYYSSQSTNSDDRKNQAPAVVPVVKDASEFRKLTQLDDRSNYVKKDTKERENAQQAGFGTRAFSANVPPRFQNMSRQNSGGFSSSSSSSGPSRSIISQNSQFSSKSSGSGFTITRSNRKDSEQSEKDRDWGSDDTRKDRGDIDRYSKEPSQKRDFDYNYDEDRKYERKFSKEYDSKSKHYNEKNDYDGEYNRDANRESSHGLKIERKNSENEREKAKNYDGRRISENENHDIYESEKIRHFSNSLSKSPRSFPENEHIERKRSREEAIYEDKLNNADRDYYRKPENHEEKERTREPFADFKKEAEAKRDYEHEMKGEKDKGRKSPATYDDRMTRNESKESRFHRGSRESLRDGSYAIQEEGPYGWINENEMNERKGRRDHYRDDRNDRNDRYCHVPWHAPKPITKAKLEAKELESDSKGNLTALVRSDRKTDLKKSDSDVTKEKGAAKNDADSSIQKSGSAGSVSSVWKTEEKKLKDESKSGQSLAATSNEQNADKNDSIKHRDDRRDSKMSCKDESGDKIDDKRRSERRGKEFSWNQNSVVYHGSSYGSGKLSRPKKGPTTKPSSRRDSKYSESEYSDEIGGSGREDATAHGDRDKARLGKSKRYERDERNRDHRMDERDYGYTGNNSRGRSNRDYYYSAKPVPRGRANPYRISAAVGKRAEGYGPSSSSTMKSTFGGGTGSEEKKAKTSAKEKSATNADQTAIEKKSDSGKSSSRTTTDRSWKKNIESSQSENKTISHSLELNEEDFATATEGSDTEEHGSASKMTSYTSKRSPTVVASKQPLKPYRSTSRKRYEGRRNGPLYSRKDSSSSYASSSKRNTTSSGSRNSAGNKDTDKYNDEASYEQRPSNRNDAKGAERIPKDSSSADSQNKKNLKTKKNPRNGSVSGTRKGPSDPSVRTQMKPKGFDGKGADLKDLKSNDSVSLAKEVGSPIMAPPPTGNAWDKPLTGALRTASPSVQRPVGSPAVPTSVASSCSLSMNQEKSVSQQTEQHKETLLASGAVVGPSVEKVTTKVLENLDGSTPPAQTIIFENTKIKSGPADVSSKSKLGNQMKSHRFDRDSKLDSLDANVTGFRNDSSNAELPNSKHDPLQMTLFNKNEDVADMKLDFAFDSSDFSKLTEDSKTVKAMELSQPIHMMQPSTDADLNFKIAAVKKVWDGNFTEHYDDGMVNNSTSFSQSFGNHASDPNGGSCFSRVDGPGHVQVNDVDGLGHNEVVFSSVAQIQGVNAAYGGPTVVIKNDSNASCSNVCKVKPQPQGTGTGMVNAGQSTLSNTLTSQPPPLSSPSYTFNSTQQANLNNGAVAASALAQLNFPAQYSVSPVPSPSVLFNSAQTAVQAHGQMYQAFPIDSNQVASRSQFSQFPPYNLTGGIGQTSAYNQQSVFVQPPPTAAPDIYSQSLHPYRLQPQTAAYANTQQISSQNSTMLTSNSLMSAAVKPSTAIGSKTTGFANTQSSTPIFMPMDASQVISPSFIAGNQIIQRPSSVVAAPGSTSFFGSASAGTGQSGYFPGSNSALQAQAQAQLGLATFNTQSSNSSLGPSIQSFSSQMYKPNQGYLKNNGNTNNLADFGGSKTITLSNHNDILNPVFQTNSQLANKQRLQQGTKNMQSLAQNSYGYQGANPMRNNGSSNKAPQYPHPIQRPVSQGNNSNRGSGNNNNNNASSASASHRMPVRNNTHQLVNNIQQPPSSVYYSTSPGYSATSSKLEASSLEAKGEPNADEKLSESIKTMTVKNVSVVSEKGSVSNE